MKTKKLIVLFMSIFLIKNSYADFTADGKLHPIPMGENASVLYYKLGGADNFIMPPVSDTTSLNLNASADLGMGNICYNNNPALSISNSFNNLKDELNALQSTLIANATGSVMQLPFYLLARNNPDLYAFINHYLLEAQKLIDLSIKSCETAKAQIAQGQNPYSDWMRISVGNQWNQQLSLVSSGDQDINHIKKTIDATAGDAGVAWIKGDAGGKNQKPIHVIADTTYAGYNTLLNRSDLQANTPAPANASLSYYFKTPEEAANWIVSVVGDQVIKTCNDESCKSANGSVVGFGLMSRLENCTGNEDCTKNIKERLANLVAGKTPLNRESLSSVSTDGIAVTPDLIQAIRTYDPTMQGMLIEKLGSDIALHRVMNKALTAKRILETGAQVPAIASNYPAQKQIKSSIEKLDADIKARLFESDVHKQLVSETAQTILEDAKSKQRQAAHIAPSAPPVNLMQGGAIINQRDQSK